MKIVSLLNDNFKLEDRKLKIQRREIAEAYKKSSTFVDASKNPTIKAIENLLQSEGNSPKESLDLSPKNHSEINQAALEVASSREFQNEDFESNKYDYIHWRGLGLNSMFGQPDPFIYGKIENEKLELPQNENNLHQNQIEPFTIENFRFVLPERFNDNNDHIQHNKQSLFGINVGNSNINSTFQKAVSTYTIQMEMAENGFTVAQPQFSLTA